MSANQIVGKTMSIKITPLIELDSLLMKMVGRILQG